MPSEIPSEVGADAGENRNLGLRHDKALAGDGLEHINIYPRGFEDDGARDRRDWIAIGVAALAHPAAHEILVEAFGRLARGEALFVAVAEPIAAAVWGMDLDGENDPTRRVEAELVFGVDE